MESSSVLSDIPSDDDKRTSEEKIPNDNKPIEIVSDSASAALTIPMLAALFPFAYAANETNNDCSLFLEFVDYRSRQSVFH